MLTKTELKKEIDGVANDMRSILESNGRPSEYMLGFYKALVMVHKTYDPLRKEGVLTEDVEHWIIYGRDYHAN